MAYATLYKQGTYYIGNVFLTEGPTIFEFKLQPNKRNMYCTMLPTVPYTITCNAELIKERVQIDIEVVDTKYSK